MRSSTPMQLLRQYLNENPQRRLYPVLVISELLLVAVLALMGSQRPLILVLLLPLAIGLFWILAAWPPLGLIIAFLAGLVVPYLGPSGLNVTMILIAVLLGLWVLDMLIRQGRIQLAPSRTVWPLLLFLLDTGARAAEVCALNLEDIDQIAGAVIIRQGKGRKPRTVFLGQKARRVL